MLEQGFEPHLWLLALTLSGCRLTPTERNHTVLEKECLAIMLAIKSSICSLEGLRCPNWPSSVDAALSPPRVRWTVGETRFQDYDIVLQCKKKTTNIVVDTSSMAHIYSPSIEHI